MMQEVYKQLAIDYNCSPDDFIKNETIITEAKKSDGRRPFPFISPRLELITFGNGVVVNCSSEIIDIVKNRLKGKNRYEILNMPFIFGVNPYYLPDPKYIRQKTGCENNEYNFMLLEEKDIYRLYKYKGFDYALQYDQNSPHSEELAVVAEQGGNIVGIASAVNECKMLRQINVDVKSDYRGNHIASTMVDMLTKEVLNRGYIPYYSTDSGNIVSQRVAVKCGYLPAWSHCYRTRIELLVPQRKMISLFKKYK